MAKAKQPNFEKINKDKPPLIYAENKIGDSSYNVRAVKLKSKQRGRGKSSQSEGNFGGD